MENEFYEIMKASGLAYDLMNDGFDQMDIDELIEDSECPTLMNLCGFSF